MVSTALLYVGDAVYEHILHQRMVRFAASSDRKTDGASNMMILNGEKGYVGDTGILVQYLENGSIKITGRNPYDKSIWKKLGSVKLQKGTYTLTGLTGQQKNTVELQLSVETDTKSLSYYCQYDKEVTFFIDKERLVNLHLRIYPYADLDAVARPAIYMENDGEI